MKIQNLLIIAAVMLASSVALAGFKREVPVEVDLVNMYAQGDMFTARTAEEDNVFIGCGVRYRDADGFPFAWGFCQAEDAEAERVLCYTTSPTLLETIRATADYSYVTFSWQEDPDDPQTNLCNRVGFSTQSFYLPKK